MNDGYSGQRYGAGGPDRRSDPYGRDPYGRDPYAQDQYEQDPYAQDPYAQDPYAQDPQGRDPYGQGGYDPYGQGGYDTYGGRPGYDYGQGGPPTGPGGEGYGYDPYAPPPPQQHPYPPQGPPQGAHQGPPQGPPRQAPAYDPPPQPEGRGRYPHGPATSTGELNGPPTGGWGTIPAQRPPEQHGPPQQREYHTEQFSFIEDQPDESEDVIDWLKFTESRTERREEAKRRGRNRRTLLILTLVLVLLGGTGYAWYADKLPFLSHGGTAEAASAADKRDVIVVHLRDQKSGDSSTALLVDNATTKKATTVLLPNSMAVSTDDGTMSLARSVEDEGAGATREGIDAVLGSATKGSWRLDTPYLELLVEGMGGITVDTDATVPAAKKGAKPVVRKGAAQDLNGRQAVAYATYRGTDETQVKQLERFGEVLHAVLKKLPSDDDGAYQVVKQLGQVPDPSLSEKQLAASLASLAGHAKEGDYDTRLLPVRADGTLSARETDTVVKDVLGGTVKNADPSGQPRVSVANATGSKQRAEKAKIAMVNGGYTYVAGGTAKAQAESKVVYADAKQAGAAKEVAQTLGLSARSVQKGRTPGNADISVVLGRDYRG